MNKKFEPFLAHSELTDCIYIIDKDDKYEVTEQCIKAMKATNRMPKWIPVSERLPETDGVYIVTRRLFDKQIDTEPYLTVDACYFDGSNIWHNDNRINHGRNYLTDIIAWMPLPQPYKVESEEV